MSGQDKYVSFFSLCERAPSGELPRDVREIRRLAAAIAVSRNEPVPVVGVPSQYLPLMTRLFTSRQKGLSWRAALTEVALEVPDDELVVFRARSLRDELAGLWESLLPVVFLLKQRGSGVAGGDTLKRIKLLMT